MNPYFQKIISRGKIGTAYLLTGLDENCLREEASRFAQTLFCQQQEACQRCGPCRRFLQSNHPDFYRVEPQKGSLKIEQIREMGKRIIYQPMEGKHLVILLESVDQMTEGAGNALLKTLEEPPDYAVFLLTSSAPERVQLTIRSRCQKIVIENFAAASLPEEETLLPFWREKIWPVLARPSPSPFATATELAEQCLSEVEELPSLLNLLKLWWHDLTLYQETQAKELIVATQKEMELWKKQPFAKVFRDFSLILETKRALEGNVIKSVALERLFYKLSLQ